MPVSYTYCGEKLTKNKTEKRSVNSVPLHLNYKATNFSIGMSQDGAYVCSDKWYLLLNNLALFLLFITVLSLYFVLF